MKCINCNHIISDDSTFCQYCGKKLARYDDNNEHIEADRINDEVVKKISIDKASDSELEVVLCDDLNILENKSSEKINYRFKYYINEINLPLKKGEVIGKVKVYNDKYIKSGNLCINKDINRLGFVRLYLKNIISTFSGNL